MTTGRLGLRTRGTTMSNRCFTTSDAVGSIGRRPVQRWAKSTRKMRASAPALALDVQHKVFLTREKSKNSKLKDRLSDKQIQTYELPLIEHSETPSTGLLASTLDNNQFTWIIITSPEGAAVFSECWQSSNRKPARIASIGAGTTDVLQDLVSTSQGRVEIGFSPSKANARTLAKELPLEGDRRVLYASSQLAGSDLVNSLQDRGFTVQRIDTYTTCPAKTLTDAQIKAAKEASIVSFGSPSAIRAWIDLVGRTDVIAACIGSTSRDAAERHGFKHIFCPDKPGLDGWVEAIEEATQFNTSEG